MFTTRGDVVKGPANRPLKRLAVEEQSGDLLILS
jgi:Rieske Fe-S protein